MSISARTVSAFRQTLKLNVSSVLKHNVSPVAETVGTKYCTVFVFVFCRKEVKDPDVLYNMLKNLLAQIKVRHTR